MAQQATEINTKSLEGALSELERLAAAAPFLALGQTVFWDEPMKAGVWLASKNLGYSRRLVAGVHDTDYFAKLPGMSHQGGFMTVPHNDTNTRGLWSAAAEFSTLFGSETVISRDMLLSYGLRLGKLQKARPHILDEATQAWGWRGIVALADEVPITSEVPLADLLSELKSTLDWALENTSSDVSEPERIFAQERADQLRKMVHAKVGKGDTVADFYKKLLPDLYNFAASAPIELEATQTTDLLRFNTETCDSPRFELLDLFLRPDSASHACRAYDAALKGTEIYGLDRFGTAAIPFDLVIPGVGRGTLRVAPRAIVVMTAEPIFISLKKPIANVRELAAAIEGKCGKDCVVIGKAVTLIGMLAREFVFVFHEGASSYVKHSRKLHGMLAEAGFPLEMNPILRVKYNAWDALEHCFTWLRLPEPLKETFGSEEVCAPSFAARWRDVARDQEALLDKVRELKRPLDLINFLAELSSGSWKCLASDYRALHAKLEKLESSVNELKKERQHSYAKIKDLKQRRLQEEAAKGRHFREAIFEKQPSDEDLAERARLTAEVDKTIHEIAAARHEIKELVKKQNEIVRDPEILKIHERRRTIEVEAELKRLRLIRNAIISSKGLERASLRPSAWWFPLVCPDGGWFKHTIETAEYYLEPLLP